MELTDAMRTQHACRYYAPDDVPNQVLYDAVEVARFGPQGGNRQPVRFLIVKDPEKKKALADMYIVPWKAYFNAAMEEQAVIAAGRVRHREGDVGRARERAEGLP